MITRDKASELYNEYWCPDFTNLDDLSTRIEKLAELGGYELCVRIDSQTELEMISTTLDDLGFDVELHNGYPDILSISWG